MKTVRGIVHAGDKTFPMGKNIRDLLDDGEMLTYLMKVNRGRLD